jgi:O-Antigen ligase
VTRLLVPLSLFLLIILTVNYQFNKSNQWINFGDSTMIEISDTIKISPTNSINSLAITNLGKLKAGTIQYRLKIRASQDFSLRVSFWLPDIKVGKTTFCNLKTEYSICQISTDLAADTAAVLVLGEGNTWIKGDPHIEIDSTTLYINDKKQFFSWSLPLQRWKGFSFNENAFASHMVVIGLLGLLQVKNYFWIFLYSCPSLVAILLSGSRGALIAFLIGIFVLILARSRAYKLLPWTMAVALTTIVVFQAATLRGAVAPITSNQSGLRSLNVADQNTTRGRIEIWRLATKAWLENPRTFLIGTGDLASAMKVKYDARAQNAELQKTDLTHAHNLFIQTAGETGLLGLCAMIALWCWVVWKSWKARDAGALALLAAIFVINSVDYLFYYAPVHLAFWMAAAGLKPTDNNKEIEAQPATT